MRLKKVKNADKIIETGLYYLNNPNNYKGIWHKLFNNNNLIKIELGTGKGDFIINSALKYPNINFIGIEKYSSVLVRAIQKSNNYELSNLKFLRMDAKNILNVFDHEIDTIYLNFSDPWPKERHSKRRLTSKNFLELYDHIFIAQNKIIMKTDNLDLFNYSINSLEEYGYIINYKTNDLYREPNNNNIPTEYEKKFVKLGIKINKLIATKKR